MTGYFDILWIALPIFLIMGIGFVVRVRGILTAEADKSLLALTINVLAPCLILRFVLGNPALKDSANLVLPPLLGFLSVALGIAIAAVAGRQFLPQGEGKRASFSLAVGLYNYGYIPLPLVIAMFDRETVGVLFLFNMGVELCMWTLGVHVLHGGRLRDNWRKLVNMPLIAIVAGVGLNLSGGDVFVPSAARTLFEMLGLCAIPLGLILSGAIVADFRRSFSIRESWQAITVGVILRCAVLPALFLGVLWSLLMAAASGFGLAMTPELARVLIVQAAMPSAVFPIVMAKHYGTDVPTALRVVVSTSAVGLLAIPLWIDAGRRIVESTPLIP